VVIAGGELVQLVLLGLQQVLGGRELRAEVDRQVGDASH